MKKPIECKRTWRWRIGNENDKVKREKKNPHTRTREITISSSANSDMESNPMLEICFVNVWQLSVVVGSKITSKS